ncbi:MAG TPA: gamma-glutamyltransferase [Abditibacteriaceae bacterium]|nr:gamma-glutamyltransferase [Abditibacteriaceae bacterium]
MVAANHLRRHGFGARIIESGRNAMDAAAAAGLTCCILQPDMTGLGGYCFGTVVVEGKSDPDASHWVQNDAPEQVNELMIGFLRKA